MNKIIYVKYSELTLKKRNRMDFIKHLVHNIKNALFDLKFELKYYFDCLYISNFNEADLELIKLVLKNTPGINNFSMSYIIEKDINKLVDFAFDLAQKKQHTLGIKTFRITCRRQDKTFIESNEIIGLIAKEILSKTDLKVDLEKHDWNLKIEVKKDSIVVFDNSTPGANGLPIGSGGCTLLLLSGGIDSPVAARQLMLRGMKVDFITFITPPHTSNKVVEKIKKIASTITMNGRLMDAKLFICNFTNLQHELTHIKKESYRITLMRRCFFKIAKKIAMQNNCLAIATGESLGQVASQTIESMLVINESADNFLVLRPLLTFDKQEIIKLATKYETYEISILPYDDSCSLFAPKNPVTKPTLEIAKSLEQEINWLDDLIQKTVENQIELVRLNHGKF